MTSQKSREAKFCESLASRSTTMASVGVWTRPTVVLKKAAQLELKRRHRARAVMPTSQSASDRL